MTAEPLDFHVVIILSVGLAYATLLGYAAFMANLSPILGYLIAGYLIGPYSPGIVLDTKIADQLAEVGVILMMFGVGLDFRWKDLIKVQGIAIPGALLQTFFTAVVCTLFIYGMGWTFTSGIIFGFSIGVASTVVLIRMLTDFKLLKAPEGLISVGWLIVEDILTVGFLLLVPAISLYSTMADQTIASFIYPFMILCLKILALGLFMFTAGHKCCSYLLARIVLTKSHELFTLCVIALTFLIATGSAYLFGTSIALGAFIAGMIIGKTEVRHKAVIHSMHMKDIFVVIFFLSVGMLFNPIVIVEQFWLFAGALGVVIVIKALIAFLICLLLKQPLKVAITVAIALAQIGEFSFILAEEAMKFHLLPDDGFDILVACAIVSISLNPMLFKVFIGKPKEA